MKGTFRILTVANIPVYVHWSFGFLLFYILYEGERSALNWVEMVWLSLFVLAVFVCVILHEFGHALTARRYGVETQDIILSPIGGVARLTRLPDKPIQEFFVALAGPMVNFAIALLLSVYFLFIPFDQLHSFITLKDPRAFIPLLVALNLLLAIFNLLPAFPLDGGRIFRALLSIRLGRKRATRIASLLGQALALGCFYFAFAKADVIAGGFGLFVFFMASNEYRNVKMTALLLEGKIAEIMHEPFRELRLTETMQSAIELLKKGLDRNFLVFNESGEEVVGILTEERIMQAMKKGESATAIADHINRDFSKKQVTDSLREVFLTMFEKDENRIVAVYDETQLVGILDIDMIYHYLDIQQKLGNG